MKSKESELTEFMTWILTIAIVVSGFFIFKAILPKSNGQNPRTISGLERRKAANWLVDEYWAKINNTPIGDTIPIRNHSPEDINKLLSQGWEIKSVTDSSVMMTRIK